MERRFAERSTHHPSVFGQPLFSHHISLLPDFERHAARHRPHRNHHERAPDRTESQVGCAFDCPRLHRAGRLQRTQHAKEFSIQRGFLEREKIRPTGQPQLSKSPKFGPSSQ